MSAFVLRVRVRLGINRVVMVARIGGVNGDKGDMAEVFATFIVGLFHCLSFSHYAIRKRDANALLGNGNQ